VFHGQLTQAYLLGTSHPMFHIKGSTGIAELGIDVQRKKRMGMNTASADTDKWICIAGQRICNAHMIAAAVLHTISMRQRG